MELYVHVPFCVKKCDYCDFVSFPVGNSSLCNYKSQKDIEKYIEVLEMELESIRRLPSFDGFDTVFIGGGTPSVLSVEQLERILSKISRLDIKQESLTGAFKEFTIECNPGTLTVEKLELFRRYGVNRLSLGLQSTEDSSLRELGRIHTYGQFLESFRMARKAGFDNINVDLMSAIPGQRLEEWAETLRKTAELGPEHISAYSLIIEEGTPFYERYATGPGAEDSAEQSSNATGHSAEQSSNATGHSAEAVLQHPPLPDEDTEREMYHITEDILGEYGYHRYEISNYAKDGFECRHNLGYWTGEEYLGVGLNAASYLCGGTLQRFEAADSASMYYRFTEPRSFEEYCSKNTLFEHIISEEVLTQEDRMAEFCILSLRLVRGIDTDRFKSLFSTDFFEKYGRIVEKYDRAGLLRRNGSLVQLTREGFDLSNTVMAEFL